MFLTKKALLRAFGYWQVETTHLPPDTFFRNMLKLNMILTRERLNIFVIPIKNNLEGECGKKGFWFLIKTCGGNDFLYNEFFFLTHQSKFSLYGFGKILYVWKLISSFIFFWIVVELNKLWMDTILKSTGATLKEVLSSISLLYFHFGDSIESRWGFIWFI